MTVHPWPLDDPLATEFTATDATAADGETEATPRTLDGYVALTLSDGTALVYDAAEPHGWVASDVAIPRKDIR